MTSSLDISLAEPPQAIALRAWATANGARIHPNLHFVAESSGMSVFAREAIPKDTAVLTAPFELAITPAVARDALSKIGVSGQSLSKLGERELVSAYVALHWIVPKDKHQSAGLLHTAYVDSLPPREALRTPLHFNESERKLLHGTNMASALNERETQWKEAAQRVQVALADVELAKGITWEHCLTAATHLSARAFPSTVLRRDPSLISTPDSHPVLLPLIDSLNHSRGHPVSWSVTAEPSSTSWSDHLFISIVQHNATPAGSQVLNNYGAKPNAELVLGYGFALQDNPDDTIVLKVAGQAQGREVGRGARGLEAVLQDVKAAMLGDALGDSGEEGDEGLDEQDRVSLRFDALGVLGDMLNAKLDGLPAAVAAEEDSGVPEGVRADVWTMLRWYVQGQRDILRDAVSWQRAEIERVREQASKLGIDLDAEEEDE